MMELGVKNLLVEMTSGTIETKPDPLDHAGRLDACAECGLWLDTSGSWDACRDCDRGILKSSRADG